MHRAASLSGLHCKDHMNELVKGYLLMIIPIVGFGITPVLVDLSLDEVSAVSFLTYRFVLASALLTPYILMNKREQLLQILNKRVTLGFALAQVVAISTQYMAQSYISPSLMTIISKSYLIFVPFVTPILLHEKFSRKAFEVSLIGSIGVIMVMAAKSDLNLSFSLLGLVLALISSWAFAFQITYSSKVNREHQPESIVLLYVMVTAVALASIVLKLIFDPALRGFSLEVWGYLGILVIGSSFLSYFAFLYALRSVPPTTGSVLLLSQTLLPFVSDYVRGREQFTAIFLLGSMIIILASALSVYITNREYEEERMT